MADRDWRYGNVRMCEFGARGYEIATFRTKSLTMRHTNYLAHHVPALVVICGLVGRHPLCDDAKLCLDACCLDLVQCWDMMGLEVIALLALLLANGL